MTERLRPRDMAFLAMESASTPMHVATLDIFEAPEGGFDYERLLALINDRIAFVPRFRQKVQQIPGRVTNPVWVDDEDFDLTYHVRRSALPRPGIDGAAARPDGQADEPADRPEPAALGDLPRRRGRGRPLRDLDQVAPGARRRHDRRPGAAHRR